MYKVDSQSKSATCETGKIYKLVLTLTQGKEYRLSFFASAIFDNKITFKIIDKSSNAVQVDLPGESANNEKGTAVLRPYLQNGKMEHPYFSFLPENTTNLEIIIEVKAIEKTGADPERGCVGVFLQNKTVENIGFSN
jgi:membrane-anchored protein YejM (alkaline phosphatase superfamily)